MSAGPSTPRPGSAAEPVEPGRSRTITIAAVIIITTLTACGDRPVTFPDWPITGTAWSPSGSVVTVRPAPAQHPNFDTTPGAVATRSEADVCTPGWASRHRESLTRSQQLAVLTRYDMPSSTKVAEWDHLISLELGGANGTKNIWPQLSQADAHRKDRLENTLHDAVCARHTMSLSTAQRRIQVFWRYW